MENLVSRNVAIQNVTAWLDFKGVLNSTRTSQDDIINSLYELVEEGVLEIDSGDEDDRGTFEITHNLRVPLENEGSVTLEKLIYQPRLRTGEPDAYMKGVKSGDGEGKVTAYICALTKQPRGIMKKLDTIDTAIAQNIVIFFITT